MQWVWKKKKCPDRIDQHIDLVQELALNEIVEFLAPSAFNLTFVLFVYGPNCDLVGNLCNGYWQFEAIQDFTQAFKNMGIFFLGDIFSTLVTAVILKVCCRINIFHAMAAMLKEFKYAFCTLLIARILHVSKICLRSYFNLNDKMAQFISMLVI